MSLKIKMVSALFLVFVVLGFAISYFTALDLKKRELINLQEENRRMIGVLTKDFFTDINVWQESQTIVGPYGFEKTGVKETQEKFIASYQKLTGRKLFLFNIYNDQGRIIASNFKEDEGLKIENHSVDEVLRTGKAISVIAKTKEIHSGPISPFFGKIIKEGRVKEIIEIYQPIIIEEKRVGAIESYFIPDLKLKEHLLRMFFIILAGLVLIVLTVFLFFSKFIFKPIKIIRKATQQIGLGIFSGYIKEIGQKDEIGDLARDFNAMIRGLNSLSGEISRLKEIGKMKSEFISIAAHQLRTPLSGIKWVLELAIEKERDEEMKNWLLKMQELNERMIGIISDLLNAARIEEGRFDYDFQEKTRLSDFLEKVAGSHKIKIEEKGIDFAFDKKSFDDLYIKADPEKLGIAFDNLIENAINYTGEGVSIKIDMEKTADFVVIKIKDAGIGIDEKDIPRLFGKFFRGNNAISRQPNGSGIGLFITKNIIRAHGGEIWVESKLNQGTIFSVKLPLSKETTATA